MEWPGDESAMLRDVVEWGTVLHARQSAKKGCRSWRNRKNGVTRDIFISDSSCFHASGSAPSCAVDTCAIDDSTCLQDIPRLGEFLEQLFSKDSELVSSALAWILEDILEPFFDIKYGCSRLDSECSVVNELVFLLANEIGADSSDYENRKLGFDLIKVLLGDCGVESGGQSKIDANKPDDATGYNERDEFLKEFFSRAVTQGCEYSRRLIVCSIISSFKKNPEQNFSNQAIEIEKKLLEKGIDYSLAEKACCLTQSHRARRNGIFNGFTTAVSRKRIMEFNLEESLDGDIVFRGLSLLNKEDRLKQKQAVPISVSTGSSHFDEMDLGDVVLGLNGIKMNGLQKSKQYLENFPANQCVFLSFEKPLDKAHIQEYDAGCTLIWNRWQRFEGESVLFKTHASFYDSCNGLVPCQLYITSYRLISEACDNFTMLMEPFSFPIPSIEKIDRQQKAQGETESKLFLFSGDMRTAKLAFDCDRISEKVYFQLRALQRNDLLKRCVSLSAPSVDISGWLLYDSSKEYHRMGLSLFRNLKLVEQVGYTICATYPRFVVVANNFSLQDLIKAAKFRSLGRIPVVTWLNKKARVVLARCSQPLTGITNTTSTADERLVSALMNVKTNIELMNMSETSTSESAGQVKPTSLSPTSAVQLGSKPNSPIYENAKAPFNKSFVSGIWDKVNNFISDDMQMESFDRAYTENEVDDMSGIDTFSTDASSHGENSISYVVMDARSQMASMGNQLLGKGTENSVNYPGAKVIFLNVGNIHSLQTRYLRFRKLLSEDMVDASTVGKESGWLQQVQSVLGAGVSLARSLRSNSVLTHCSDGWDRTTQMCSLAMLLMDDYYRTIEGFCVLIEKEWCSFGHKFQDRIGAYSSNPDTDSDEHSPVFLIWVDCVWQMMWQFPNSFEFNQNLLSELLDHTVSGQYGTFLFNSEKERIEENRCHEKTASLWSLFLYKQSKHKFVNPNYCATGPIDPITNIHTLKVWESYYFRFNPRVSVTIPVSLLQTLPRD